MASYVVPQVEIHQLFSEIPVSLTQNQIPFVFGPNYLLHRYDAASEKTGTYAGEYVSTEQASSAYFLKYPEVLDDSKVDASYTKLFGDNVLVKLTTFNDVKRVTATVARGFNGDEVDDTDSSTAEESSLVPNALEITLEGATSSTDEISVTEISVGRQLRLHIADTIKDVLITGVTYTTGTSNEDVAIVTIDEELDDTVTTISSADLCEVQNGVEFPREDKTDEDNKVRMLWSESVNDKKENGIKIETALVTKIADKDFITDDNKGYGEVLSADLYITYRELITSASDTIHTLTGATEVANAIGAVHPDNPLAQAVYNAALNAGGQTVRYMAVPTDDADGYSAVLNAASLTKEVYFLVPVTRDSTILDLVQAHVNSMSAATTKRWRIAFVSAEIPEEDPIYTATATTGGRDFKSIVKATDTIKKTADIRFVVINGNVLTDDPDTRFKKDLKVGDVLRTSFNNKEWGVIVPKDYKITAIISNNVVRVADPNGDFVGSDAIEKSEIYHPYTNAEKAETIRDISSSFADRRMYNVFPSVFTGSGVTQTGEFAAACVAGLVASCLPQQPVTNLELTGIDDIPLVYQTFSFYDLNTMASGGTFIVMQDMPNDQVYIRHQISTDYEANNLNTAELSITKNLDSISYFFDDLLSPYIGKYNITPELLVSLRSVILTGIGRLTSNSYGLYGSQLISEGTEILLLEQDALLKDHVNCNLQLNMPYPFNHLVLKLFV